MRQTIKFLGVLAGGVGLGAALLPAGAAGVTPRDPLDARVAELERLVVRDPLRPETAVLDRLAAVEKGLRFTGNADDIKTPDDLKQAVVRLSGRQDDLDRRLKAAEAAAKPAGVPASVERDLRDLKQRLQDQRGDVKDLESRVHRVESRF